MYRRQQAKPSQKNNQKKCKKPKWLSEESLEIARERREVKNRGELERYTQLNAQFQRLERSDEMTF